MAIITGYNPARMPQNQQWFQLPIDKMYDIMSNAQRTADINRADMDELSSKTFAYLPQDEAEASAAKEWLRKSADSIVEKYGDDPRAWSGELNKLRREVAAKFDPNTGDIGVMQARTDLYKSYVGKANELYKDDPALRDFYIKQIQVNPLGASLNDKATFGIAPGGMVKDISKKIQSDTLDQALDNILADTYAQLTKSGSPIIANLDLEGFRKAFVSGEIQGIDYNKIINTLVPQIDQEWLDSNYQRLLANGVDPKIAENELNIFLTEDAPDGTRKIKYDANGNPALNPANSLALKIMGMAQGKSYSSQTFDISSYEDNAARLEANATKKKFDDQLIPWEMSTFAVEFAMPWGNTEKDITNYIQGTDKNLQLQTKSALNDFAIDSKIKDRVSPENLRNAKQLGVITDPATGEQHTQWKLDYDGGTTTFIAGAGALEQFNASYDKQMLYKKMAEESLSQSNAAIEDYMVKKYGKDWDTKVQSKMQELGEVGGYSSDQLLEMAQTVSKIDAMTFKEKEAYYKEYPEMADADNEAFNTFTNLYMKHPLKMKAYKSLATENSSLLSDYQKTKSDILTKASKNQLQGVSTTNFSGDQAVNEKMQKDLQELFTYGNARQWQAYTPLNSEPETVEAAIKRAIKESNSKIDYDKGVDVTIEGPVSRTMLVLPDGNFHWQVNYKVSQKDGNSSKSLYVKVLVPSNASAGLNSPLLEQMDTLPEARAIEALLLAKNFNLTDVEVPGTNLTVRGVKDDSNRVIINYKDAAPGMGQKAVSWKEAADILTELYTLQDIMKANPGKDINWARAWYNKVKASTYYEEPTGTTESTSSITIED